MIPVHAEAEKNISTAAGGRCRAAGDISDMQRFGLNAFASGSLRAH